MSQDQSSDRALRHRRLIDALDGAQAAPVVESFADVPVDAAGSVQPGAVIEGEECVACDLIEQRLGRRTPACEPMGPEAASEVFTLSKSARVDHGAAGGEMASLADDQTMDLAADGRTPSETGQDQAPDNGLVLHSGVVTDTNPSKEEDGEPWQTTFDELNAALEFAKSRLHSEGQSQADGDRHEAWPDRRPAGFVSGLEASGAIIRLETAEHAPTRKIDMENGRAQRHAAAPRHRGARFGSSSGALLADPDSARNE